MVETLYARRHHLILGFHGCDKSVMEQVLSNPSAGLLPSTNDYDWLGSGIYFWENSEARAWQWAKEQTNRRNSNVQTPAVIGAIIDLGRCLDLVDIACIQEVEAAYRTLRLAHEETHKPLPQNQGSTPDRLMRYLDCAVIETTHLLNEKAGNRPYDSVRAMFREGKELYENAGFSEKNHVQICVRNPNCIKGYFLPRPINKNYLNI